jgi:hypothetical protein
MTPIFFVGSIDVHFPYVQTHTHTHIIIIIVTPLNSAQRHKEVKGNGSITPHILNLNSTEVT